MLLSPHFCYRFDRAEPGAGRAAVVGVRPGQPAELFPLVEHARRRAAGPCRRRRPARAGRARSRRPGACSATTASGAWPRNSPATGWAFRRFEEHNSVDRERFASFTNELRQAMYEEPIRFFVDVVQPEPFGARFPLRRSHVRQPDPGQALRHARSRASVPTSGSGSTTRTATAAAASCRWRSS